ncbi:TIGR03857 family LLM class F420-dependent oxidoreductase [Streptomyces sp. NPDC053427]|uniref:TIGR03857 family LLM class F420-dependent oxidoreductase n=1 Tax=Streptomyces sp. NPDC053427 TaxID=3365701 RepID=UPI0037D070B3
MLSGGAADPRLGIDQAIAAERMGLETVWLSERWGTKDLGAVAGAIGQATQRVNIAAGITPFQTRHPLLLASLAGTLQSLTGGRFILGLGRGGSWLSGLGVPPTATARVVVDTVTILRRLWAGETVSYHGPAGDYPALRLTDLPCDVPPPPLVLAALGPRSLELAGRHFDGALLPAFLTTDAVARASAAVRAAAAAAGRDPAAVLVHATVIVMADRPPAEEAVVSGRAVTYLQAPVHGERLARLNGWDPRRLDPMLAHPRIAALGNTLADTVYRPHDLVDAGRLLPHEWLKESTATGSSAQCVGRLREYAAAGADRLVLHGSPPELLARTVSTFLDGAL